MAHPYVIIGAGIIGASIARELASRGIETLVLDKEPEAGLHASGRNSGVIHSGINHKAGSEKARFCLEGSRRLRAYCRANEVPMRECGKLVIAQTSEEVCQLERLLNVGNELGVPNLSILSRKEMITQEPVCTPSAHGALFSPTDAIVDSKKLLSAVIDEAKRHGARFSFNEGVDAIYDDDVITTRRLVPYRYLVNASGLGADRLAHMRGFAEGFFIVPFKGSYWQINGLKLKTMIYPLPDPRFPFLGIHLTPTPDGLSMAGPNAALALGREAYNGGANMRDIYDLVRRRGFWKMVMGRDFLAQATCNARTTLFQSAFLNEVGGLINYTPQKKDVEPYRAGIRAQLVDSQGEFVDDVKIYRGSREMHILNATSPGMTTSLVFAEHIVETLLKEPG